MSDASVAPSVSVEPPKIPAGRRLLLAFTSPSEVFEDIARKPSIAAVFGGLLVTAFAAQAFLVPKLDMTSVVDQMGKSGMDDATQEKALHMINMFKWVGIALTPIQLGMWLAILAGIYFLALKLLGSEQNDFVKLFSGIAHAAWPAGLVHAVLTCVVSLTRSTIDPKDVGHLVKSNLGGFLSADTSPALIALGDSIDLFAFWNVALVTLALSKIGKVPKAQAATLAIVVWFLGTVVKVGFAALGALARK